MRPRAYPKGSDLSRQRALDGRDIEMFWERARRVSSFVGER
jgi:hypothetical protein